MREQADNHETDGLRGADVPAPTLGASAEAVVTQRDAAIDEDERAALRTRRRLARVEDDAGTPTVGLALSGGGIRAATFSLGLLRGMARRGVLSRFDYLSTVSGGGYIGAMFGRLVGRIGIAEAEHVLAASDSRPLAWLRRYGRYLAPRGARDYGMGLATYLRAMVAVHLEFAFLALTLGLIAVLPHAVHRQIGVFEIEAWLGWPSAWWPLAVGLWLATAPGLLGVYWMLRDAPTMAQTSKRPRFRLWDLAVVSAAAVLGLTMLSTWVMGMPRPWVLPAPGWTPLLGLVLSSLGVCGVGVWLALQGASSAEEPRATVARMRRGMTGALRAVNVVALCLAMLGLLDWASWSLRDLLRDLLQDSPARLYGGLGLGGVVLIVMRAMLEPLQKWLGGGASGGAQPLPMLAGALGYALAFGLCVLWTTLAQWLVFAPPLSCDGSGALEWLCTRLFAAGDAAALWLWATYATALVVWFVCTGTNAESANTTSLHNMYAARLVRAYLGAANHKRMAGDDADDARGALGASAIGTSPELLSNVTAVHAEDDVPLERYDPAINGGPIHLVNVCLNQTRGHRSGLYNADRKGVPLVASAYGLRIGRAHLPVDADGRLGTLGRWVAISGAAASPGAGAYTTPGWASLLFLGGARLGYWLDMRGAAQTLDPHLRPPRMFSAEWWRDTWQATKMGRLASEFRAVYGGPLARNWYLSDGGHFDNTGVHPLLERQLDLIVLADCGADPRYEMADLENLVRKARIDFGADIEFYTGEDANALHKTLRGDTDGEVDSDRAIGFLSPEALADNTTTRGLLLARILYRADAEGRRKEGRLVVVKPNLHAALDMDLLAYARRNPRFPQQPTGDQFFDEAQWESYHRLGEDFGAQLRRDWLLALAGRERLSDPPRIRASRLQKEEPAAARAFWRIDAKGAAVGALSIGALLALLAPTWQVVERLRGEREALRKELVSLLKDGQRVHAGMSGSDEAARAKPEDVLAIARLRELSAGFDRDSAEGAIARQLLVDLESACASARGDRPAEAFRPCGQLRAPPSAQTRARREYWARPNEDDVADRQAAEEAARRIGDAQKLEAERNAGLLSSTSTSTPGSTSPPKSAVLAANEVERQVRNLRVQNAIAPIRVVGGPTQGADDWRPQQVPDAPVAPIPTIRGAAQSVKLACADGAGRERTRLFIHVFDESGREALLAMDWESTGLFAGAPPIENVAVTAAARGERPPRAHPQPTLLLHDPAHSLDCARALGLWLAQSAGGGVAQPIRIRPLPKGYAGRPGMIELWWPPTVSSKATAE